MTLRPKQELPPEHWNRAFAPSSCLALITTVDTEGRVNAAPFATCVRVNHHPVRISFTAARGKDTCTNALATRQFVINLPSSDAGLLEKVRITGLPFARGVNELEKAGLTPIPATTLRPPRIVECRRHFECVVHWTGEWDDHVTIIGTVVAASVDEGCVDKDGYVIWSQVSPVQYAGVDYGGHFLAAYEVIDVPMTYEGPERDLEE